jgi:hypothetical protein
MAKIGGRNNAQPQADCSYIDDDSRRRQPARVESSTAQTDPQRIRP